MNIVICDDEAPVRELIKTYILKQSSTRGTGSESQQTVLEYASGESLVRALRSSGEQIDILFLDISFGDGADGMETAAAVRALYEDRNRSEIAALPIIIFVTGDEHRMPEAFHVHAFQYIVKPIREVTFREILTKAEREVHVIHAAKKERAKKLVVQQNGVTASVDIGDIQFVESSGRKVILHLKEETVEYYGKISDMEGTLGSRFFRVHRSFLVNMDAVKKYSRTQAELTNGETVLMSKYQYPAFVEAYMKHIGI